jgi:hypothetical protein
MPDGFHRTGANPKGVARSKRNQRPVPDGEQGRRDQIVMTEHDGTKRIVGHTTGEQGRMTEHDRFARCPECGHATVGLKQPYAINHAAGCSAPDPVYELDTGEQGRSWTLEGVIDRMARRVGRCLARWDLWRMRRAAQWSRFAHDFHAPVEQPSVTSGLGRIPEGVAWTGGPMCWTNTGHRLSYGPQIVGYRLTATGARFAAWRRNRTGARP